MGMIDDQIEQKEAFKNMVKATIEAVDELCEEIAVVNKKSFNAHMKQGFTRQESIALMTQGMKVK